MSKVEERKLRQFVKKYLQANHEKKLAEQKQTLKEEKMLRTAIRKLLQEKESVVPGASTGENELESVLTAIIPAVESDYKKLTTSVDQRKSYRAHIIRAAIDILLAADAKFSAEEQAEGSISAEEIPASVEKELPPEATETLAEQEEKEGEGLDIKIGDDEDKMIDVDTEGKKEEESKEKTKEEQTEESFTIPGQDLTGRNIALRTWNKRGIGTTIKNGYRLLDNAKDRKIFFDYLLTNLKLYFDKFEKELQGTVNEPTTQAYEKIKQTGQSYESQAGGGQAPAPAGAAPLAEGKKRKRLVESTKLYDQIISHLLK
jgi:hypothetical protein